MGVRLPKVSATNCGEQLPFVLIMLLLSIVVARLSLAEESGADVAP